MKWLFFKDKELNVCFSYVCGMYFDIAMPLTLFAVVLASIFLDKKTENKLKATLEEKKFRTRDAVMLVVSISIAVSLVVYVPQMAIVIMFLFAYSMLLVVFTYLFSDVKKLKAQLFLLFSIVVCLLAVLASWLGFITDEAMAYWATLYFGSLAVLVAVAVVYEFRRGNEKERWYLAALPPALFVGLYLFFSRSSIWFPYLLNVYGIVFALLIILYLGSLFTWKTSLIFAVLLTAVDIILVLFTGTMVSAAKQVSGLMLPILVSMPTLPEILLEGRRLYMSLGLGDFFFAGLLTVQTLRRYGKTPALLSLAAIAVSFFIFEVLMLNFEWQALPGTLMIICGWAPIALGAEIARRRKN
ncbi:hypothetical protein KEJ15_06075 [Candidatus Bathyarchaeota archaeon]|nr:hypothetical protein [Candidatus Bathyarchaeota archaeon]